ncbi:GNAT family N-acetyltransferase [Pedobacter sp.]|uniref:GNAT family N-acetyltransferase n=1 Tax=Pedobacter sp. TaxID=1411316 RepID=UPI0031CE7681
MENIMIRPLNLTDVNALQQISRITFLETFAKINTEENMRKYLDESFSTMQLSEELGNSLSQFYFAELNNEVIGYLKLNTGQAQKENAHENALEIERIYVLQDHHGKKVGQLLYQKAMEVAQQLKVEHVWLGVWEKNFRAMSFYKKNGFVAFDEHVFVLGNDRQIDILMKKDLNAN